MPLAARGFDVAAYLSCQLLLELQQPLPVPFQCPPGW